MLLPSVQSGAAPDTQHGEETCCCPGAAFTTPGARRAAPSAAEEGGFHGGVLFRGTRQMIGTPAAGGGSRRQMGTRMLGEPSLPGQGEETCCWHSSALCFQGPNSLHTDQLIFLHFLRLLAKHLTHMKISPSSSLFRDVCLPQRCQHRHISECVLFQINGPDRQQGQTYRTAVTTRQVHPARSPRGWTAHSRSSGSCKQTYLLSGPCGTRRQKVGEDKVIRRSWQHWPHAPAPTHTQPAAAGANLILHGPPPH